jgi:tryptophan synthase
MSLKDDPEFQKEFKSFYPYIGRPSSLHVAQRLTEFAGSSGVMHSMIVY